MTGRNLKLHETIDVTGPNGEYIRTVTRGERVIEYLATGSHFDHACPAAGMTKETGYEYIRRANQARIKTTGRTLDTTPLTDNERACIQFADGVERAAAEAATNMGLHRQRLMVGGILDRKTTTRTKFETRMVPSPDNPDVLIPQRHEVEQEVTTVESRTLPDGAMIRWWFERRFPKLYGRQEEPDNPAAVLSDEERAEPLVQALRDFAESDRGKQLAAEFDAAESEAVNEELAAAANGQKPKRRRDARGKVIEENPES